MVNTTEKSLIEKNPGINISQSKSLYIALNKIFPLVKWFLILLVLWLISKAFYSSQFSTFYTSGIGGEELLAPIIDEWVLLRNLGLILCIIDFVILTLINILYNKFNNIKNNFMVFPLTQMLPCVVLVLLSYMLSGIAIDSIFTFDQLVNSILNYF